jgi:hypothetical protein
VNEKVDFNWKKLLQKKVGGPLSFLFIFMMFAMILHETPFLVLFTISFCKQLKGKNDFLWRKVHPLFHFLVYLFFWRVWKEVKLDFFPSTSSLYAWKREKDEVIDHSAFYFLSFNSNIVNFEGEIYFIEHLDSICPLFNIIFLSEILGTFFGFVLP